MSTAQAQPDPNIGRSIVEGQFLIEKKIGSGGMGSVYRASQPAMNRLVAVKILHPKLTNRKDLAARFRREARAMSHLQHPNTVKVFLFGELDDGSLYIVMEYLEGKNLNQTVRREGPLSVERSIPILVQVCGALHEAHTAGIIHRDLKPENIFLSTNGGMKDYAKVLDFGLAKVTERELRPGSIMLTQEGMVFGTPEFMSPEQAQGKKLDARSDLYSLATILYEMLTGKLPYDAKTPMEYIQLHVTKAPIPLSERVPGKQFPRGLSDTVMKALSKSPEGRFASALEFAEALKNFERTANPFGPEPTVADGPTQVRQPMPSLDNSKTIKMQAGVGNPFGNVNLQGQAPHPQQNVAPPPSNPGVPGRPRQVPPTQVGGALVAPHQPGAPISSANSASANSAKPSLQGRGVNMLTLVIVAVACLLIGVGLTTLVIFLTQRP